MNAKKKSEPGQATIALNKKARHDFSIDRRFEAGISLLGWEVKALRAGKVQLRDAYILLKDGEAFLFGALITPLPSASSHIETDPRRSRKLLLHRQELDQIIGAVERKGFALVATAMYWKNGKVKLEIALARGKKQHDKRASDKDRDWKRDQARIMKSNR